MTKLFVFIIALLTLTVSAHAGQHGGVGTPAIPTEFQGEWCSVPDSEFGEYTRGRCQGEYSDGWLTVFSDHMEGHEWGCTLKRRVEFGTLWGGEFECGAEATLSVTTYMLHIDGVTGRLVRHAVGWQWSWTEESEDENREATVVLSEGHNLAIEKCQYGNVTFSFPRNFAELPKPTQRKWDNQHRVWVKWRGGEPIQLVATESAKYGAHTFTFDLNKATVLTMASRDTSMFVCASASGDCTDVSMLNMVRAIEFVCATKAASQANSEAKPNSTSRYAQSSFRAPRPEPLESYYQLECALVKETSIDRHDPIYKSSVRLTLDDDRNVKDLVVIHHARSGATYNRSDQYVDSNLSQTPGKTEWYWTGAWKKRPSVLMRGTLIRTTTN